ncbi:twin-arginine translocase subunit TatB [Pseudooceanicola lipolyticus]|uniref:Sec-independent protein translocase protein TatB n=1 Tax=Pseudooceanicola lipolyticus TaxID=2029104 RepID=A0A2M8J274_9RHOB|nr:Sec-independent protein translocase protein TatB [Pseudooceanicola lipolyticus]PJE36854.1 twin-arginine translocase subunit TatB [Pseudooceanicola lipolyticus]
MFDLGWTELLLIGIVALIVVGPKDLPVLFRNVGIWVGKARGMAREFSRAMNDAADESGVKDVAKGLKAATNPVSSALDGVKSATRDMTKGLDPTKYTPDSETGKLAAERAESAKKIQAATARAAAERKAREAAEALAKAEEAEAALKAETPAAKREAGDSV